jgi:hypothetical protein
MTAGKPGASHFLIATGRAWVRSPLTSSCTSVAAGGHGGRRGKRRARSACSDGAVGIRAAGETAPTCPAIQYEPAPGAWITTATTRPPAAPRPRQPEPIGAGAHGEGDAGRFSRAGSDCVRTAGPDITERFARDRILTAATVFSGSSRYSGNSDSEREVTRTANI